MRREEKKCSNRVYEHLVYKPKWKWFKPPRWWCFRWAYVCVLTDNKKIFNPIENDDSSNNIDDSEYEEVTEINIDIDEFEKDIKNDKSSNNRSNLDYQIYLTLMQLIDLIKEKYKTEEQDEC